MQAIKTIIKQIKSYFKSDWNFNDYPTRIWKNPDTGNGEVRYGAEIINWTMMVEQGETTEKALAALRDNFILFKRYNKQLARPGRKVPIKFASENEIVTDKKK